mgnify:FL=1
MDRISMIRTVGLDFLTSNIENGEFSYAQVLERPLSGHFKLDIRFYDKESKTAVLIETKQRFKEEDKAQLFAYVALEQEYNIADNIVAILANTSNDKIQVWQIAKDKAAELLSDKKLKTIAEYAEYFKPQNINDKSAVLENTAELNRKLHDNGIKEKIRSQFVGTCLLALKNGLTYKGNSTGSIIGGIKEILGKMIKDDSSDKATKIAILQTKVLEDHDVENLNSDNFVQLLDYIQEKIIPYINAATSEGHDILSYFFTTFNKYVAREDKNQAFTPNHIAHFMGKVARVCKTSHILDPTCGSGTFLVQAMTMALNQCETDKERTEIKKHQIYGIEKDPDVFGLSTTNMLIHGDGNSNIRCASCFDVKKWIEDSKADIVLMNPPYNASKSQVPESFAKKYGKSTTDPSKGLYFVKYIADTVGKGRLVTLLPMSCAITTNGIIADIKEQLLDKHTLDAVFSFPAEMFYPGASAVACCMVFDLGRPHSDDKETFFGYFKDDGFEKRKGVGRVDIKNKWDEIEKEWLSLYDHRETKIGKSITKRVSADDEWCAEAYMETDYRNLCEGDFINTLRDYAAFLIQNEQEL